MPITTNESAIRVEFMGERPRPEQPALRGVASVQGRLSPNPNAKAMGIGYDRKITSDGARKATLDMTDSRPNDEQAPNAAPCNAALLRRVEALESQLQRRGPNASEGGKTEFPTAVIAIAIGLGAFCIWGFWVACIFGPLAVIAPFFHPRVWRRGSRRVTGAP